MNRFLIRATLVLTAALVLTAIVIDHPVRAQIPPAPVAPAQWPPAAYSGSSYQPYPFPAPTPRDAYREGLINRGELERFEGPQPQALQGPPVDSSRGGEGGGGRD